MKHKSVMSATRRTGRHGAISRRRTSCHRRFETKKEQTHDLELDSLALQLDSANLEVYANGADVALRVGVIGETEEQTRLDGEKTG